MALDAVVAQVDAPVGYALIIVITGVSSFQGVGLEGSIVLNSTCSHHVHISCMLVHCASS